MPRSSRMGGARVPPLQGLQAVHGASLVPGMQRPSTARLHTRTDIPKSGSLSARNSQPRSLDSWKLREHVMRAGRAEVDVRLWVRQVCNTPREEDPGATWSESGPMCSMNTQQQQQQQQQVRGGRSGTTSDECGVTATTTSPIDARAPPTGDDPNAPPVVFAPSSAPNLHSVLLPRTASAPATPRGFIKTPQPQSARGSGGVHNHAQVKLAPFLGMEISQERYPNMDGLRVVRLTQGAPAASAGLHVGDYIKSINGKRIASKKDLRVLLASLQLEPSAKAYQSLYIDAARPSASIVKVKLTPVAKALTPVPAAGGGGAGATAAVLHHSASARVAASQHSATLRGKRSNSANVSLRRHTLRYP